MENVTFEDFVDSSGRKFEFAVRAYEGATDLVVHFSAFFERIKLPGVQQREFSGYFHRLRMLGDDARHNWLFFCDSYGSAKNGTFYTGEKGDFFVERAINDILPTIWSRLAVDPSHTVAVGSSAGGTAAIKFGLLHGMRGIVAIGPHVDLDICAATTPRFDNVAFVCPDGDPLAEHNWPYTRQIRRLIETRVPTEPLPNLFVQSCRDDTGVYDEQIVPLVEQWRSKGGDVTVDARKTGGHTSRFATAPLLNDVVDRLLAGEQIDVAAYQADSRYAPAADSRRTVAMRRARRLVVLRPAVRVGRFLRRVAADGWPSSRS